MLCLHKPPLKVKRSCQVSVNAAASFSYQIRQQPKMNEGAFDQSGLSMWRETPLFGPMALVFWPALTNHGEGAGSIEGARTVEDIVLEENGDCGGA